MTGHVTKPVPDCYCDSGWVCEAHLDKPFPHDAAQGREPCPRCFTDPSARRCRQVCSQSHVWTTTTRRESVDMFSSRVMLLWLEVRDLALRNVPESSRSDVINRVTSTSLQVHEHFAIALAQPDYHDHFQQRAIDAFADLGAQVLRLAPGESHDELTLELTRLMERLSVAYHEPPPDQLRH